MMIELVEMTLPMTELLDVISGTVELLETTGKLVEMTSEAVVLVEVRSGLVSLVDMTISSAVSLVDGTSGTVGVGNAITEISISSSQMKQYWLPVVMFTVTSG